MQLSADSALYLGSVPPAPKKTVTDTRQSIFYKNDTNSKFPPAPNLTHFPRNSAHSPRNSAHSPRNSAHAPRNSAHSPRNSAHSPRNSAHSQPIFVSTQPIFVSTQPILPATQPIFPEIPNFTDILHFFFSEKKCTQSGIKGFGGLLTRGPSAPPGASRIGLWQPKGLSAGSECPICRSDCLSVRLTDCLTV